MTFIKPKNQNEAVIRIMLVALVACLVCGGAALVLVYNMTVNIQHALSDAKSDLRRVQSENAELQDEAFSVFAKARIEAFVASRGLVQEKAPQYVASAAPRPSQTALRSE